MGGMDLSTESRQELLDAVGPGGYDRSVRARAQIVLWHDDGFSVAQVAARAGVTRQTVYKWLDRYAGAGLEGLSDLPRPGGPRIVSSQARAKILALSKVSPPAETGLSHWSSYEMAKYLAASCDIKVSHNFVATLWRENGLRPHASGTFKIPTDPKFEVKVADVVGLYLNPPEGAVVLSVDEKTQVQALDRTQPLLPMTFFKTEKRTHDYVRHGTTNLFAALDVGTGHVTGRCYSRRRSVEFIDFCDRLVARYPDTDLHMICDNLSTHNSDDTEKWLEKHPRVHIHYTPAGSSWMNQVENWFSIITKQAIRRGTFASVAHLKKTIEDYIAHWNHTAAPFAWEATADDIIRNVQILQRDFQRLLDCNHNLTKKSPV